VDKELLEAVWANVTGLGSRAVTNAWHKEDTLEAASHSVVDTLWLSPVVGYLHVPVTLVANESLGALLNAFGLY
jgi:hypothetical protein